MVGNRIAILSPHPGRLLAEINSHEFDLHSLGSKAFQDTARRVHGLLFDETDAGKAGPPASPVPGSVEADAADLASVRQHTMGQNALPFRISI